VNLLILLIFLLQGCLAKEDETKPVIRGQPVVLTCPVDIKNCGELHSIKWFKGTERVAVLSGNGEIANVEGVSSDRLSVEHAGNKGSKLHIQSVQVDDEAVYLCEITYLEPLETCDTTGAYSINVQVVVPPSAIVMKDDSGNEIRNGTIMGPLRESQILDTLCEVRGARPQPKVGWYRAGKRLQDVITVNEWGGLFHVEAKLSLVLSRQELSALIECRVETAAIDNVVSNQIMIDLQVKPTRISLTGFKLHVIEGAKVLLVCQVDGGRPAANVTWYNNSNIIDDKNELTTISTKNSMEDDGTFDTTSQMIFTATRFENGVSIRCEADNIVMRDDLDKPLHDTVLLEVMYPPVVTVKPENITLNETDDFLLFCEYEANPNSLETVRWLLNGRPLNINQSRYDGGNPEQTALLVKNATRLDSGLYTCELTNTIGTGMSENSISVNIQYVPIVSLRIEPNAPVIENRNENVTLYCDVRSGNPGTLLRVQWYLNGNMLEELPICSDEPDADNRYCFVDPHKMLLENVGREFLGNYSCKGFNAAGWGEESKSEFLEVYYEPGNATISYTPDVPLKGKSMVLSCSIDEPGNPPAYRYKWLRGNKVVKDVVTPVWTIDPVGLDARNEFSCAAYNEGGEGVAASVNIEVHAPPAFIQKLQPYSGVLFSTPQISLSCRVECYPMCGIFWFMNGVEITDDNFKYFIRESHVPSEPSTGDFESVLSVLYFNLTSWPNKNLDIHKDNANYSCISSNNSAGSGVNSGTYLAVEYPPENVNVSQKEVFVNEGSIPPRVVCSAESNPVPSFKWRGIDGKYIERQSLAVLAIPDALWRKDAGTYVCEASNKHGKIETEIQINIRYAPNCTITREKIEGEDTLICRADGNPQIYDYMWEFKSENETVDIQLRGELRNRKSFLLLNDDFHEKRVYRCIANNTVGNGTYCEIQVAGHLLWWQTIERRVLYISIAIILVSLIAVIIVCCIIIYICRNRRKRSSKSMEKSLVESKPNDPAEVSENYENLPFHGLQSVPPNKPEESLLIKRSDTYIY
jgi:hypothetical protein